MKLTKSIEENREALGGKLRCEKSFDLIERTMRIGGRKCCMYFVDGFIKDEVMQRIMDSFFKISPEDMAKMKTAHDFLVTYTCYVEVALESEVDTIGSAVLSGPTALLIDGYDQAIMLDLRTYPVRSVEEPDKEKVLRGSRDGFVETIVFNTALIRRRIRDYGLTFEMMQVGKRSKTDVVVGYIDSLADQKTVAKIKKQIASVDVESLTLSQQSLFEAIVGKAWINPMPKIRYTERPDVACSCLLEGKIIVIVDNSPTVAMLPTFLMEFMQEPDDYYFPLLVGNYLRVVRNITFLLNLILTPLWYLLISHPSLIPPWLAFIQVKETGAIPILAQLLILEFGIDALRIASLNTPSILSSSLSIVGGLILGDFAVSAGFFIPETILYMAFSAVAIFSMPSYELGYAAKFIRIFLLLASALFGLWGFIIGAILVLIMIATTKTISGQYYLYPLIPFNFKKLKEVLFRRTIPRAKEK